jgi:uroporphyrinogen decarboxylase
VGDIKMKIAFSPSVYEHAAFLLKMTPWKVSRNAELLYRAHRTAHQMYQHSPIVVGIDIYNIEAEAYGCVVTQPSGNGIPAITKRLFAAIEETRNLKPFNPKVDGRIPLIIEAGKKLAEEFPGVKISVPVSGPFSIAVSLRGLTGLLEDVALFPEQVAAFLNKLVEGQVLLSQAAVAAGLDVAFFESAAAPPLLSPKQFREVELPALKEAMTLVGEVAGHAVPCIIGGDTEPILNEILDTGTSYVICPAETDQAAFMAKISRQSKVQVRINLNPRTVAYGSRVDILAEVDRILALANGRPNVLLGTGAVPYETPPENILLIRDYVS